MYPLVYVTNSHVTFQHYPKMIEYNCPVLADQHSTCEFNTNLHITSLQTYYNCSFFMSVLGKCFVPFSGFSALTITSQMLSFGQMTEAHLTIGKVGRCAHLFCYSICFALLPAFWRTFLEGWKKGAWFQDGINCSGMRWGSSGTKHNFMFSGRDFKGRQIHSKE